MKVSWAKVAGILWLGSSGSGGAQGSRDNEPSPTLVWEPRRSFQSQEKAPPKVLWCPPRGLNRNLGPGIRYVDHLVKLDPKCPRALPLTGGIRPPYVHKAPPWTSSRMRPSYRPCPCLPCVFGWKRWQNHRNELIPKTFESKIWPCNKHLQLRWTYAPPEQKKVCHILRPIFSKDRLFCPSLVVASVCHLGAQSHLLKPHSLLTAVVPPFPCITSYYCSRPVL